jgi:hypothetical protein
MPQLLYPCERPCTLCIGGWVGPRAGLDRYKNLASTGIQSPDCPACSKLLYKLRYAGPSPPSSEQIKNVWNYRVVGK